MNMNMKPSIEQRRAHRKQVSSPMPAVDVMSDQVMGQVGNLSATGIMLIGARAPVIDAVYQISVALPGEGSGQKPIEIGIQEQWNESAGMPGQFWSGYRIVAISDADNSRVEAWLADPDGGY
jgi:hypothetical protein